MTDIASLCRELRALSRLKMEDDLLLTEEEQAVCNDSATALERLSAGGEALRAVLENQTAMMGALHPLLRGFLARDELGQSRLSARIEATRDLTAPPSGDMAGMYLPADFGENMREPTVPPKEPPKRSGFYWERRDGCQCKSCPWKGSCLGETWPHWIEVSLNERKPSNPPSG